MKRNIFFAVAVFLAFAVSVAPDMAYSRYREDAAAPVFEKTTPGEVSVTPNPVNLYPRLPFKELIFSPWQIPSSHAPSIVELPDGGLLAVWYAPTYWSSDGVIWSSARLPGSGRWTEPRILHSVLARSSKNPVLYLGRDKVLRLFWAEETRWCIWRADILRSKASVDFGKTWTDPYDAGIPKGFLPRTHPITLNDGRVIFPVYADWNTSAAVSVSKDGASTWGKPIYILYFFGIQPTIIQRSDLSLFALTRSGMWPRLAWQAVSGDLGDSWKDRKLSNIKNPGSSIEMIKLHSGNVALVFNDSRTDRAGLSLALSYDDGRTWPCVRVIEYKSGRVNCYPSIMQDRYGLIHVLYSYDGRKSIAHFVTNEQWIEGMPAP